TKDKTKTFIAASDVKFATLYDEEIDYYVDTFSPMDKAGAYGIQEWIGYIGVESINGSYFNVMGLPIQRLYRELKEF
ncbi:MAG: Maf family protein, partial [Muribaculaceae bacterium]|nr:Maf family protein [Muribaculaceae bacterium]